MSPATRLADLGRRLKGTLRTWRNPAARAVLAYCSPGARPLVRQFLAGGRIPWSTGYGEYRLAHVMSTLDDPDVLPRFRRRDPLPPGFGIRLDERVVEYPWVLASQSAWGPRVLDAGSTLNYPEFLSHSVLSDRTVVVVNLAHDWTGRFANVAYVTGDLRRLPLREASLDVVVCISTLEHVGLDNRRYAGKDEYRQDRPDDFRLVLREFRRVLRTGGRLLVTVPFGRPRQLGWLQQFDAAGVAAIVSEFTGSLVDESYFKYEPGGWTRSTAVQCRDCEYFDVTRGMPFDDDYAAAARAVACLDLVKREP